jgi:hypothetical protein
MRPSKCKTDLQWEITRSRQTKANFIKPLRGELGDDENKHAQYRTY